MKCIVMSAIGHSERQRDRIVYSSTPLSPVTSVTGRSVVDVLVLRVVVVFRLVEDELTVLDFLPSTNVANSKNCVLLNPINSPKGEEEKQSKDAYSR